MNPLRWLVCWWYRRHIPVQLSRPGRDGVLVRAGTCARCGKILWRA